MTQIAMKSSGNQNAVERASPPAPGTGLALLGGILAIAMALGLFHLGARSFWLDESASADFAQLTWNNLGKILWCCEGNMSLYYALLHLWIGLVGDSEFSIRILSVVMAVGAVGAIYGFGARFFDARVALTSALLMAVNAYQIAYAQEARGYSLLLLLVIVASFAFVQAVERPTAGSLTFYVITSVLAVYAHVFAVLVLAAHWFSVVFLGPRRATLRIVFTSAPIICLLLTPLIYVAMRNTNHLNSISRPSLYDVHELFYVLTGSSPTGAKPLLAAYFIASAAALIVAVKQFSSSPLSFRAWRYFFLLTWFFVPILLTFGVSIVKPIYHERYMIICLPPLVLLASVGISRIPGRFGAVTALIVIVAMAVYEDTQYYRDFGTEDWRGAVSYVVSHSQPTDGLVFYPAWLQHPYDYYRPRLFPSQKLPIAFPLHWSSARMANGEPMEGEPADALLRDLPRHYSRIWLFSRYEPVSPRLLEFLREHYARKVELTFRAVNVALYSAAP